MAASEGHMDIIQCLKDTSNLKNLNPIDRWGNTPLDDAKRGIFKEVEHFLIGLGCKTRKEVKRMMK